MKRVGVSLRSGRSVGLTCVGRIVWFAATALGIVVTQGVLAGVLINGGFEDLGANFQANAGPGVMELQGNSSDAAVITGWHVQGGINAVALPAGIAWMSNDNLLGFRAAAGSYFLNLAGADGQSHRGGVTLDQSFATVPGQSYALSFALGTCSAANGDAVPPILRVILDGNPSVRYFQGNTAFSDAGLVKSHWETETFVFQATGTATFVTFNNCTGLLATDQLIGLDDVRLVVVPEGSPARAGMGAVVLALRCGLPRRRRTHGDL